MTRDGRLAPSTAGPSSWGSRPPASELLIITGMSGAGRSTAAKVLEDLGWFVVDNLPPQLHREPARARRRRPAARCRGSPSWSTSGAGRSSRPCGRARRSRRAAASGTGCCSSTPPTRRWCAASSRVRRPHPLQGEGRLLDGIVRERGAARRAAGRWPTWSSTPLDLNVHQLAHAGHRRVRRRGTARRCGSPSCRSASSTACRSTPTSSSTCASCPTRTGCRSCARTPGWTARARLRARPARRRAVPRQRTQGCSSRCSPGYVREGKRYAHARGRLHRRQAPQRGDGRGARRAAARPRHRGPRHVHRDLGRE